MQLPFSKQLIAAALIAIVAPSATVIGAQSFSDFISKPRPYVAAQEAAPPPDGPPPSGEFHPPPPGEQPGQPIGEFRPPPPPPGGQPGQAPGFGGPQGNPPQGPPPGDQQGQQPGGQFGPPLGGFQPQTGEQHQPGSQQGNFFGQPPGSQPGQAPSFGGPQGFRPFTGGDQPPTPTSTTDQGSGDQQKSPGGWTCATPPQDLKCEEIGKYPNGCSRFKCEKAEQRHEGSSPPPALAQCAQEVLGSEAYEQMVKGNLQPTDEQKKLMQEKCGQFKREMPRQMPSSSGEFGGQQQGGQGFGPGGPGGQGFGPGGSGEQGFGPSEEDMQRMEKEQKTRMLKDMQRGLRGMEMGVRMMERGLKACVAAKVDVGDATSNLAKIKEIVAKVKAATDPEELQDIMSDLPDLFESTRETVELCSRLREIPRILKQVNREIKQLESEHRKLTTQAKRAKLDLTEELNSIKVGIDTVKALAKDIGSVRDADSFEAAMENLEGLQETFQDLREKMEAIRGVLNIGPGISQTRREIRNAERMISTFKRQKKDTTELVALLSQAKTLLSEIEALAKQKPLDVDAVHEKFEELEDVGHRAEELIATLRGAKVDRGFADDFQKSPAEDAKLPDVFKQFEKEGDSEGPSEFESLLGF